jgi:hypothetical protein
MMWLSTMFAESAALLFYAHRFPIQARHQPYLPLEGEEEDEDAQWLKWKKKKK